MKMLKAKLVELAGATAERKRFPTSKVNRWITVGAVKSAHMYSSLTLWLKTLEQVLKWVISVRLWTATSNGFINAHILKPQVLEL